LFSAINAYPTLADLLMWPEQNSADVLDRLIDDENLTMCAVVMADAKLGSMDVRPFIKFYNQYGGSPLQAFHVLVDRDYELALRQIQASRDPFAYLFLALAQHEHGKPKEALAALGRARQWLKEPIPANRKPAPTFILLPMDWKTRVEVDLLTRLVEEKLKPADK
jgi:hypothetical protein